MATFPAKPAAGSFTINSGHAQCPDFAYLFTEGSGTTVEEAIAGVKDLSGAALSWSTVDLGQGGSSPIVTTGSSIDTKPRSGTGTSLNVTDSLMIVALMQISNRDITSVETLAAVGSSTDYEDYVDLRGTLTTERIAGAVRETSIAQVSREASSTD